MVLPKVLGKWRAGFIGRFEGRGEPGTVSALSSARAVDASEPVQLSLTAGEMFRTTSPRVANLSGQAGAQFLWSSSARVKTNICAGALAPKELTGGYSRPGGHVQAWC